MPSGMGGGADSAGADGGPGTGVGGNSGGGMGGFGGCCFIANTQIAMADGSYKFIQDIEAGDLVLGKDDSKNTVTGMETPPLGSRSLYSFNGGQPFVTSEHPFWTPHGWAALDPKATAEHHEMDVLPLHEGDAILRQSGRWLNLERIDDHDGDAEETVYNLMLNGTHTYYANGFLVHNKGGDDNALQNLRRLIRVRTPYSVNIWDSDNEDITNYLNQQFDVGAALRQLNAKRDRKGRVDESVWNLGTRNVDNLAKNRKIAGQELQRRIKDIGRYNTGVEEFNQQASSIADPLQSAYDFLSNADIAAFEDYSYGGPSLDDITALNAPERPTFGRPLGWETTNFSGLTSGGWSGLIGNIVKSIGQGALQGRERLNLSGFELPEFADPFDTSNLPDLYESAQDRMGVLGSELDIEQARNQEFLNALGADVSSFDRRLDRADIYDTGAIESLYGGYDELLNQLERYDSPLGSFAEAETGFNTTFGGLADELAGYEQQYDTERSRVDDFLQMLNQERLGLDMDIDDFTIADIDQIGAADTEIEQLANQVIGFESPIDLDMSNYLNQLEGLDDELDLLRQNRENELGNIRSDRRSYQGQLRDLNRILAEADPFRGSALTGARSGLDSLRDAIQYYESPLAAEADFSGVETGIGSAEAALNELFADRTGRIGTINDAIAAAQAEGTGAELYDEDAMRDALRDLTRQQSELGRFSGSGLEPTRSSISSAQDLIDARLDELGDYRGGIEQNAQQLLENFMNTQFYGTPEIEAARAELDPIIAERDLYDATAANDEVQEMLAMLTGQEGRLAEDEQSRLARSQSEQQRQLQGLFGVPRDYVVNQLSSGRVTPEEYQILLGKVREKDPEFANLIQEQYDALLA